MVTEFGTKLAGIYYTNAPEVFSKHNKTTLDNVEGEWVIPKTPFTSGIINKNNPLKYHFDTGNFRDVYSAMVVFKKDIDGGYLSLPEYNVGMKLQSNSVFLFDGQSVLHGVTPIKRKDPVAYRYSIVYYSLRQMWNCDPLNEELARIRQVKTERELKRTLNTAE